MNKIAAVFIVCLFVICPGILYASDNITLHANLLENKFEIKLKSNPTTGYQWTVLNYDKNKFKFLGHKYIAPSSRLMGAGGVSVFSFSLISGQSYPKSTEIDFVYSQKWSPSTAMAKKIIVKFN